MLVVKKNVLESAVEDIKHDLYTYEFLQQNLHRNSSELFVNFSATFSDAAQKMISSEKTIFGKQLTKGVLSMIKQICSSEIAIFP